MSFAKSFLDTGGIGTGAVSSSALTPYSSGGVSPSGASFVGDHKKEGATPTSELVVPLFDTPDNVLPHSVRLSTQREYTFAVVGSLVSIARQLEDGLSYEDPEHFQFRGHGTEPGAKRDYNNAKKAVIMSVAVVSVQNSLPFGVHITCNHFNGRSYGADGNRGIMFIPAETPGTVFSAGPKLVKVPECGVKFTPEFLRWLYRDPADEGPNEHEHRGYESFQFFTDRHPTWQYLNDRLSLKGLSMDRHRFPMEGASEVSYYLPKKDWEVIRDKMESQKRKITFVDLTETKIDFVPYGKGGWPAIFAKFGTSAERVFGSISVTLEIEFF